MELQITPHLGNAERDALRAALEKAGVSPEPRPRGYESPWRHAASREAVENQPVGQRYARSPRSTRGATSA
jgi:hypothetical protein